MRRNVKGRNGTAWDLDKPERVVGFLLKSLQHTLRQSMDEALRARGVALSFAHLATLFGLHYEPGIAGAQLARRAMVSAQTMNSILRRLEADALIERRPHPESRRADSWSLTAAGQKELARARTVGDVVFSRMLAPLAPEEVAVLQDHLRRCITALEGPTAPPQPPAKTARAARRRPAAQTQSATR